MYLIYALRYHWGKKSFEIPHGERAVKSLKLSLLRGGNDALDKCFHNASRGKTDETRPRHGSSIITPLGGLGAESSL